MFTKKDETIILIVTGIISLLWIATTLSVQQRLTPQSTTNVNLVKQ